MTPMDDATAVATMDAILAEHEAWLHDHAFTRHVDWHPGEDRAYLDAAIGRVCDKMEPTTNKNGVAVLPTPDAVANHR